MAKQMENGLNQEIEGGRQSTSRDRPNLGISRDSGASIDVPCLAAAVSGSTENGPFEFAVTRETQMIASAFGRWGSFSRKS